jgi:hypothetical protein
MTNANHSPAPQPTPPATTSATTPAATPEAAEVLDGTNETRGASRRHSVIDRRTGVDRRDLSEAKAQHNAQKARQPGEAESADERVLRQAAELTPEDREAFSGLERRRGAGRRLSDFSRAAEEGELTTEQFLFVMAIEEFKKANQRVYPTWTDVLEVVRLLGYRKTMASELNLRNAEDWHEKPDAPANVRPQNWHRRFAA